MTVAEIPRGICEVAAQSRCPICISGDRRVGWRQGAIAHRAPQKTAEERYLGLATPKAEGSRSYFDADGYQICPDYDPEGRHIAEPLGFYTFTWWPKICRNGKRRWMTWVERHRDGTYTLGDRAF